MNYPIEIDRPHLDTTAAFFGSIVLIGIGLVFSLVGLGMFRDSPVLFEKYIISSLCFFTGVSMIFLSIWRLCNMPNVNSPVVSINAHGILINKDMKIGPIEWNDIVSVTYFDIPTPRTFGLQRSKGVKLQINNRTKYLQMAKQRDTGKLVSLKLWTLSFLPYGKIIIGQSEVDAEIKTIYEIILREHQRRQMRYDTAHSTDKSGKLF